MSRRTRIKRILLLFPGTSTAYRNFHEIMFCFLNKGLFFHENNHRISTAGNMQHLATDVEARSDARKAKLSATSSTAPERGVCVVRSAFSRIGIRPSSNHRLTFERRHHGSSSLR